MKCPIFKGLLIRSKSIPSTVTDGSLLTSILAVGCTSGRVVFLDAITLNDIKQAPFDYAKGIVKKIAFSSDSNYCAYIVSSLF